MITRLIDPSKSFHWTLFHIVLGYICIFTPWALILWFYFVLFSTAPAAFNAVSKNRLNLFTFLIAYLLGFELLDRMALTSPFIPYELGKYLLLVFLLLALLLSGRKSYTLGIYMVLLITPAAFYDFSGNRFFFDVINNFFGPLALALGVALWGSYKSTLSNVHVVLHLLWYTCLSALIFAFFKTPDYDNIYFSLRANSQTTGGHSSNQVATILGFGMFLSFYAWLHRLKFSGYRLTDGVITALFAFQGFLTFSRGGMIVGVVGMILAYILNSYFSGSSQASNRSRNLSILYFILGLFVVIFMFRQVDKISGGKLSLRYQGETEGTLLGAEKNLNKLTAGRSIILQEDIALWLDSPILGVGAGASRHIRLLGEQKAAAHLEFSRLLAEHGIAGLFYFLLMLRLGWIVWKRKTSLLLRNILIILYLIALATSFHSAMRTYITPLLIAISVMPHHIPRTKKNHALQKNTLHRRGAYR